MINKKYFILVTMVFFLLIVIIIFVNNSKSANLPYFIINLENKDERIYLNHVPVEQTKERIYKDATLKLLFEINSGSDSVGYSPAMLRADKFESFYYLCPLLKTIFKYSIDGRSNDKYGKTGKGPGEFTNIKDFFISDNGSIYVLGDNKISTFNSNNISEYKLTNLGWHEKFLIMSDSTVLFLTMPDFKRENILNSLNIHTNKIEYYETIFNNSFSNKFLYGFVFTGTILSYNKDIVYVPTFFNLIYYFNNGKVSKVIKTIDHDIHPNTGKMKHSGKISFTDQRHLNNIILNDYSFIIKDSLYIFSKIEFNQQKKYVFDIYDAKEGHYCYSKRFNYSNQYRSLFISESKLYITEISGVVKVFTY